MISNQPEFSALDALIAAAPDEAPAVTAHLSSVVAAGPTMSSLQIAEITGKRHDHVIRDIEAVLTEAGIGAPKFGGTYRDGQNKERPCYLLPRRECDLVVSGYSVKYRLAIIDRWHELEAAKPPVSAAMALNDPATLRSLLLDNVEKVLALETAVLNLTPKADALERIALADGSMCITNAAKHLQLRPKDLFRHLREMAWIYRRGAEWTAYQNRLQQGYLEQKVTTVDRSDGSSKVCQQVLVTAKGLARLAELAATNFS